MVNLVVLLRQMPRSFKIIIPWHLFKFSLREMESWQDQRQRSSDKQDPGCCREGDKGKVSDLRVTSEYTGLSGMAPKAVAINYQPKWHLENLVLDLGE